MSDGRSGLAERPTNRLLVPSGAGAGVLALMLVLAAAGTSAAPRVVIGPPYSGVLVSTGSFWSSNVCGKGTLTNYAKWPSASGVGAFGGAANAKSSCKRLGPIGGGGSGQAYGDWYLQIPVKLPNGTHSVMENWTVALTAFQHFTVLKGCPNVSQPSSGYAYSSCSVDASYAYYFSSYMSDLTSNNYYGSPTSFPNYYNDSYRANSTYCSTSACSYSNYSYGGPGSTGFATNATWYFNGTFNGSHSYVIYFSFSAGVSTSANGYTVSAAFSGLTLHYGTTLTRLTSITIV